MTTRYRGVGGEQTDTGLSSWRLQGMKRLIVPLSAGFPAQREKAAPPPGPQGTRSPYILLLLSKALRERASLRLRDGVRPRPVLEPGTVCVGVTCLAQERGVCGPGGR